jgi:DNA-binding NarL/FixJ family response regulator
MSAGLTVLLVEDQPLLADAFTLQLEREADVSVVETAPDRAGALMACAASPPDLVVLDIDIEGDDGFGVAHAILERVPRAAIVMMSDFPDDLRSARASALGAYGLMSTREAASDVAAAVRRSAERIERGADPG